MFKALTSGGVHTVVGPALRWGETLWFLDQRARPVSDMGHILLRARLQTGERRCQVYRWQGDRGNAGTPGQRRRLKIL